MDINNDTIDQLAHLARLEFDKESKEAIKKDINRMLAFVNQLNEINTDGVEPLIYMSSESNIYREDEVKKEIGSKEALKNAPKKDSDFFKVPKVVEKK